MRSASAERPSASLEPRWAAPKNLRAATTRHRTSHFRQDLWPNSRQNYSPAQIEPQVRQAASSCRAGWDPLRQSRPITTRDIGAASVPPSSGYAGLDAIAFNLGLGNDNRTYPDAATSTGRLGLDDVEYVHAARRLARVELHLQQHRLQTMRPQRKIDASTTPIVVGAPLDRLNEVLDKLLRLADDRRKPSGPGTVFG